MSYENNGPNPFDLNTAQALKSFEVIPHGEIVVVRTLIKPGGYNDPSRHYTDGLVTHNAATGTMYLAMEYTIIAEKYKGRKVWGQIGLHSPKGPTWAEMGRSFIRALIDSSKGLAPDDISPNAQEARRISGFKDLDNLVFVAKIDVETGIKGEKNTIKYPITKEHQDYAITMNGGTNPNIPAWGQ
jgi:hypothetical protein